VRDSSGDFGASAASLLGAEIPIRGVAGDQQAALVGQGCFERGMAKSTYGTGCFLLLNTGEVAVRSTRMLSTVAYRLGGRATYAMEGSIFVAGAAVKWLRDGLHVLREAAESAAAAASVPDDHGVYLVPAFVGLGAPHWEPDARGLICGLTLDSGGAHLVRASLEAVAYQTRDLTEAMRRDGALPLSAIRVDGGMAANDWFCQFLADILAARVERPAGLEATVTGAAFLAGLAAGVWADLPAIAACVETAVIFSPRMSASRRATLLRGWRDALARALPARSMADATDE
jgi:glycerol kinase